MPVRGPKCQKWPRSPESASCRQAGFLSDLSLLAALAKRFKLHADTVPAEIIAWQAEAIAAAGRH